MLTLDEPAEWREACIASLQNAPINLRTFPGNRGDFGSARADAIQHGTAPLVSWADPDDVYNAEVFAELAKMMMECPQIAIAYSDEVRMGPNGKSYPGHYGQPYSKHEHRLRPAFIHGAIVIRREVAELVAPMGRESEYGDWIATSLAAMEGPSLYLPKVGRWWRQHDRQAHRKNNRAALQHARKVIFLYEPSRNGGPVPRLKTV